MDVTHPNTGRRAGLSQAKITQAAKTLTREHGLENWSIRDLAQHLQVAPSVIYHYFASRDAIVNAIIGQLVGAVPLPDENLEWKAWFMALAQNLRPTLLAHPGVTERMMYGNLSAEMLPILEVSFRKLHEAGFRHYAPQAYTMILNTILWIITARNLRSPTRGKQRHDLNQMVAQMQVLAAKSPTLAEMVQNYFVPLADPQNEDQMSQEYFDLMMESMLAGLEITILPRETDA
ncbi:TetR/AcrR family transcriptional regulator [Mobiluncus mulieris]|uniref:TetR/AcrR family transcriptional regulator n=1 Tax=Mobiluncus mulieris TaxID=2052 RepID=UPI00146FE627|nr:TetR/AcrR family transcriptional regulator [Mobiluncus mulieris]MCU9995611.1 TetR/AcrR family transcriptional regulator [Mobiluncus mulieris]NMW59806.1 TetR/AcrR family transcriptional regulator [Mobiluncus mulieris]